MKTETVFNSLMRHAKKEGVTLTHLKVQKLLYFLHGYYLAKTGKPLLDEPFQAWQYGPVECSLYNKLRSYGGAPIDKYFPEIDKETGKESYFVVSEKNVDFHNALNMVWDEYGNLDGVRLSTLSHEPGSPWATTSRANDEIDNKVIKDYFSKKLNQREVH